MRTIILSIQNTAIPKRNYSDYRDEEKGLVLLKKFLLPFGQEENAKEIAQRVVSVREQIKEALMVEDKPAFSDSKDEFTDLTSLLALDQVEKDLLPLPPD